MGEVVKISEFVRKKKLGKKSNSQKIFEALKKWGSFNSIKNRKKDKDGLEVDKEDE